MSVSFCQVTNIKLDFFPLSTVSNDKVKPKYVATSVRIDAEKQIVFKLVDLDHTIQITPLKSRLKQQLLLQIEGWIHAFESSVKDLVFVELIIEH